MKGGHWLVFVDDINYPFEMTGTALIDVEDTNKE